MFTNAKKGFSAIEFIVVLAVLAVTSAVIVSSFYSYRTSAALERSVSQVAGLISQARIDTLSAKSDTQYGIHFETDKVVLFQGDTYDANSGTNVNLYLDSIVSIANTSLEGSGDEIIFKRLTGETDEYGTITLALTASTTQTAAIEVFKTGLIEVQ